MKNLDNEILNAMTDKIDMPDLKEEEAKQMSQAYSDMFTALTYTNLLQGKSLGQSWFNSVQQIDSFIKTKDKFNSVTNYMQRMLNKHRKILAKKMMTDPNRDKIIQVTDEKRQEMMQKINEKMQSAMQTINDLIEKYRAKAEKLKEKLEAEAKKRQEKLLKEAKKAEKAQKAKPATKPVTKEQVAPMPAVEKAAPAATQEKGANARPPRPVLSEYAKHKAMQQMTATPATTQPAKAPVATNAPAQTTAKPAVATQKNNTAAQFVDAQQKIKMMQLQRARIQMFINQNQNQRAA